MNPSEMIQKARCKEEKIYVTVRVRPLSSKEIAHKDVIDWECANEHTIIYKHPLPDRSPHPASYTFDRVFGPSCNTKVVYEEGAKNVALSALTGINSTIFAYGQTSSGKTYTMRGVIESAVVDIYEYIEKNHDREFVLKISGLEIYNEVVKDLLNPDSGPLRLLDDPEKGVIVDRLNENIVRDSKHLRHVLSICDAQRQVGETMLNDASSRSHQIIRLTVESFPRGDTEGNTLNTMVASLNFVDLAGSERASQSLAEGARLKEGCHINRSLLTLSTVIRKLSGGNKFKGHVPYRDSKLTRILQHSLGGNARTAIICTMSPAHCHVDQSRNTLSFATRAKEVTNTAHVNVVISDKDLVKQLQKEVARLEAELKIPDSAPTSETLLQEKELQIQKMEMEMKQLTEQRDLAQAKLNELLQKMEADQANEMEQKNPMPALLTPPKDGHVEQERNMVCRQSTTSATLMLVQEIRKLEKLQDELGEDAGRALEALQKEVECLRLAQTGMNHDAASTIAKLQAEIHDLHAQRATINNDVNPAELRRSLISKSISASLREEISRLRALGGKDESEADVAITTLEEQLESVQMSLDKMVLDSPGVKGQVGEDMLSPSKARTPVRRKKLLPPTMGSSTRQRLFASSPTSSPRGRRSSCFENNENTPPKSGDNTSFRPLGDLKQTPIKSEDNEGTFQSKDSPSAAHRRTNSVDIRKMQKLFKTAAEENIKSIRAYVTELKERVAKLQYQKQLLVCQVLELEANANNDDAELEAEEDATTPPLQSPTAWHSQFEHQSRQIIELWHICQVSIVHRTQFYLLFKGDPADAIYMEVELRRLTWMKDNFSKGEDLQSPSACHEDNTNSLAASSRALRRERELLAKRMRCRLTVEEREELFVKWNIPLDSKQRKLQLAEAIWIDPHDKEHIQASAEVVARVVGFFEPRNAAAKEMFELSFAPPASPKPWLLGWNSFSTLLNNI